MNTAISSNQARKAISGIFVVFVELPEKGRVFGSAEDVSAERNPNSVGQAVPYFRDRVEILIRRAPVSKQGQLPRLIFQKLRQPGGDKLPKFVLLRETRRQARQIAVVSNHPLSIILKTGRKVLSKLPLISREIKGPGIGSSFQMVPRPVHLQRWTKLQHNILPVF